MNIFFCLLGLFFWHRMPHKPIENQKDQRACILEVMRTSYLQFKDFQGLCPENPSISWFLIFFMGSLLQIWTNLGMVKYYLNHPMKLIESTKIRIWFLIYLHMLTQWLCHFWYIRNTYICLVLHSLEKLDHGWKPSDSHSCEDSFWFFAKVYKVRNPFDYQG